MSENRIDISELNMAEDELFARMNPDHKKLYTIISVLTLGFARSAMVFGMRNDFPAEEIYQKR